MINTDMHTLQKKKKKNQQIDSYFLFPTLLLPKHIF